MAAQLARMVLSFILAANSFAATLPRVASVTDRGRRSCSIVAYGAQPGNRTADAVSNARAIQRALASCGKVTVPAGGVFKLTPIVLPSHTELFLERGSSLVGSERWQDYGIGHMLPPLGNSGTQPGLLMIQPLISATDATNITISGANGTIDGSGWAVWPSANWSNPECGLHHRCAKTPGTESDAPGTHPHALLPPPYIYCIYIYIYIYIYISHTHTHTHTHTQNILIY